MQSAGKEEGKKIWCGQSNGGRRSQVQVTKSELRKCEISAAARTSRISADSQAAEPSTATSDACDGVWVCVQCCANCKASHSNRQRSPEKERERQRSSSKPKREDKRQHADLLSKGFLRQKGEEAVAHSCLSVSFHSGASRRSSLGEPLADRTSHNRALRSELALSLLPAFSRLKRSNLHLVRILLKQALGKAKLTRCVRSRPCPVPRDHGGRHHAPKNRRPL